MKKWFVAHTQALKESIAAQHLLEQGFEVYVPRFKKTTRHARKIREVLAPLFPRYIFVSMDLDAACWRSINGTRGVAYVLTNNERPAEVPDQVVQSLRAQENAEGLVSTDSLDLFVAGDRVLVLDGAFKDQTAVFECLDDKQRVQLLLSFLGREIKVSLPLYAVEAA
jgi:transcriptional antiterminator RfaH